ncbi:FUSC family protein [Paraburkholderia phytofirmans]|uniref:Fusaric acid resistance protein conserved region n=1 Tax=Paraburkholderia phytofirmans (strain DSM 17436 / LMG 22146 / PsJN) TaxID=398527 RepID=B2TBG0_PARPJ|nr:FUSC family protein [Paraburkholderia phytofirmans]ACD19163.1 Fusaric acid resistance protein conserved region [Paraburkholderia phytofirmans PsJN]
MKREHAIEPTADSRRRWDVVLRMLSPAVRDWTASEGLIWLHLLKTVTAGLLALGIAMLLDLPQPRIAMTTVFVLMQPFSGMVLAKSFYRILGTAVGTLAALVLGALFVQQPELYMLGMIGWVSACIAAAVRYRHFRWYGFVLAGYTAALIGIPNVTAPHDLFLAALTRAAEVAVGIVSSSAVSALIVPQRSSLALRRALQIRYGNFTAFAADVLTHGIKRGQFERRFAGLVDEIVGFEATRTFAAFEDPAMRSRNQHLGRLNGEFMDACARLHALHQLLKRLRVNGSAPIVAAIKPYFDELAALMAPQLDAPVDASRTAARLQHFQASLPRRVRETRRPLEAAPVESLADFDTAAELLYRFVDEWIRYSLTYASVTQRKRNDSQPRTKSRYVSKTNTFVVALTFIRSAVVMAIAGWFWIMTDWPSGGLAVIGAALACALTSTAPNPSKMAVQMAVGAVLATMTGYLFTCYVYPNIDGFPLLCTTLAPVLALGAFIATRKLAAGYGIGFSVFFCLLAGPDNVVTYAPDLLINNGMALTASMLLAALVFAVVFPADMPWLIGKIMGDLRAQVVLACKDELPGLNQRFQSSTHDLTSQLRMLLTRRSRRRREALRWTLATLEVGHAVIDLRNETARAGYAHALHPRWTGAVELARDDLARLFERPDSRALEQALVSVRAATWLAQNMLQMVHPDRDKRHDLQRILSCLHFIRTALLDKDAPFNPH